MARILSDGTVIPSFLSFDEGSESETVPGMNDFALKIGTVIKVHYPDQDTNIRKNRIEYDVQVRERSGHKGFNINTYTNCIESNLFGGAADSIEWTYRPTETQDISSTSYITGSSVLLLCLHGDTNGAVIVGGTQNPNRKTVSTSDRGHFLEFEFNGVNVEINKDGELIATYKSKTDLTGAPQDEASGGTYIKIDKTGTVEIHANDNTLVKVDKPGDNIQISADKVIREEANSGFIANAPDMKIGGDGANEPLVLGTQWMIYMNTQIVPKINALIAAVSTLASPSTGFPAHTHSGTDSRGDTFVTSAPTPTAGGAQAQIPSTAAPSGAPQLSDFVKTKKSYSK